LFTQCYFILCLTSSLQTANGSESLAKLHAFVSVALRANGLFSKIELTREGANLIPADLKIYRYLSKALEKFFNIYLEVISPILPLRREN
jgi:hypothetical protein